jgi:hypothetical protein
MQYWLINYDATCPSGWYTYGSDCYTNSNAAEVSTLTASQLATVQMTGSATAGGNDAVPLSVGSGTATSVTNGDSKVDLAPLIGVLTTGGTALAKQGSPSATWVTEDSGISQPATAG